MPSVDPQRALGWLDAVRLVRDPDGARLRGALAATLAAALAAGIATLLGPALGLPRSAQMVAGVLAMIVSVTVGETTPESERRTFGLLLVPLTLGLAAGTVLAPHATLSLVGFVLAAFASVMLQRLGARGTAAGSVGFRAYFFALFFQVPLAHLTSVVGTGWLAIGAALIVRMAFAHGRTQRAIAGLERALPILAADVLRWLGEALTRGDADAQSEKRRVAFQRLNEAALALEDRLELVTSEALGRSTDLATRRAFELEVAAERVGAGVLAMLRSQETSAACREALARALAANEAILRGRADTEEADLALAAAAHEARESPHLALAITRFGDALSSLRRAAQPARVSASPRTGARPIPEPASEPEAEGLDPTTRLAIQVSIATAAAVFVGRMISPDRWFWAALAAYLVIAPSSTRGEILVRAGRRTLGTFVGVMLGAAVATLVVGHPRVELALLFLCVFLAMYARKTSYTVMVMWLTAGLALLYQLTGRYSEGLLYVRLEETAAGAAIGALCAALVLPSHTGAKLRGALARFLSLLGEDLEDVALASREHARASRKRVRALDRALLDVRAAAEPLTRGGLRLGPAASGLVRGSSTLAFYARQLAMPGLIEHVDAEELAPVLAALVENVRAIAAMLAGGSSVPARVVPIAPLRQAADLARASDQPQALDVVLLAVERMGATLDEMRTTLDR